MDSQQDTISAKCIKCSKNIVWENFWVNLALGIFKGIISFIGGSEALIADALHSIANAVMAGIVGVSLKISNKPVDKEHPYGHGKAEFLFAALVALLFMAGAAVLLIASTKSIIHGSKVAPNMVAAWATIASIIANEIVFRRTLCVSQKVNSLSISTSAWGSRTDSFSSIAALIGILFAKLGLRFMDSLASIMVSFFIIKISIAILRDAIGGLVDVSLPPEQIKKIRKIVAFVDGVESIPAIRTRRMGRLNWIDIEIDLNAQSTIAQADYIALQVKGAVSDSIEHVGNVVVYFNPAQNKGCD